MASGTTGRHLFSEIMVVSIRTKTTTRQTGAPCHFLDERDQVRQGSLVVKCWQTIPSNDVVELLLDLHSNVGIYDRSDYEPIRYRDRRKRGLSPPRHHWIVESVCRTSWSISGAAIGNTTYSIDTRAERRRQRVSDFDVGHPLVPSFGQAVCAHAFLRSFSFEASLDVVKEVQICLGIFRADRFKRRQ